MERCCWWRMRRRWWRWRGLISIAGVTTRGRRGQGQGRRPMQTARAGRGGAVGGSCVRYSRATRAAGGAGTSRPSHRRVALCSQCQEARCCCCCCRRRCCYLRYLLLGCSIRRRRQCRADQTRRTYPTTRTSPLRSPRERAAPVRGSLLLARAAVSKRTPRGSPRCCCRRSAASWQNRPNPRSLSPGAASPACLRRIELHRQSHEKTLAGPLRRAPVLAVTTIGRTRDFRGPRRVGV